MNELATTAVTLTVDLRREPDGPAIASEAIQNSDLIDARAQLWLAACPPHDRLDRTPDDLVIEVEPVYRKDARPFLAGFQLSTTFDDEPPIKVTFPRTSMESAALRLAARLRHEQVLGHEDAYFYVMRAGPPDASEGPKVDPRVRGLSAPVNHAVEFLRLPLDELLEVARPHGVTGDPGAFPVFFTKNAWERADRIARRGADQQPTVETGGVLIGPVCFDPDARRLYTVVTDVLEATDADATQFSLAFSGANWARIQASLRARRSRPATRYDQLLGSFHSHPFLPAGGSPPCDLCEELEVCTRTTAALSEDDRIWSRAVFRGLPWQLAMVHGLNARNEPVETLHTLADGLLMPRDYAVIPDFAVPETPDR